MDSRPLPLACFLAALIAPLLVVGNPMISSVLAMVAVQASWWGAWPTSRAGCRD